jgi:S-adenosylmethionine synthetase
MKSAIEIQDLAPYPSQEMAERKGLGHPDTLCDEVVESVSKALSTYYLEHFGSVFHYNVDKALLVGGASAPKYKGGKILEPIELFLAGRATSLVNGEKIPVDELAVSAAKKCISAHLRFLDVEKDIRIIPKIRPGSSELVALFKRFGAGEIPLANDTSFGVGYYPFSDLEKKVLEIELFLNSPETKSLFPYIGEDIKVMGVRHQGEAQFTVAVAMVDRFIADIGDYVEKINSIRSNVSGRFGLDHAQVFVNTADNYPQENIYLTVSGTSAENGDDGQVGRGNRVNGLITPFRPMSLEASAGKNPISHVGKIYNHFAFELARELVAQGFGDAAEVFLVSQIGKPITQPQSIQIKLQNRSAFRSKIEAFVMDYLGLLPHFWKRIVLADK